MNMLPINFDVLEGLIENYQPIMPLLVGDVLSIEVPDNGNPIDHLIHSSVHGPTSFEY